MNVTVLGAGSWGATLGMLLAKRGHDIRMWEFRPDVAERIEQDRELKDLLPGIRFPDNVHVTSDINESLDNPDICLLVIPSHAMRSTAELIPQGLPSNCIAVSAAKGIEEGSLMRMSEVLMDGWGSSFDLHRFVCLSGPSHAEEVVRELPTSIVAASVDIDIHIGTCHRLIRWYAGDR